MYEPYSRQSLPSKEYRELLGSALCAFASNNGLIVEIILNRKTNGTYNWHKLIDMESGKLNKIISDNAFNDLYDMIKDLFNIIVKKRNRIMHSFRITDSNNRQILATKEKHSGIQYIIDEEYLHNFIKDNDKLCVILHEYREKINRRLAK